MRRPALSIICGVAAFGLLVGSGCTPKPESQQRCDAGEYFKSKMETDPEFRRNHEMIIRLIEEYYRTIDRDDESSLRGGRIIIPVVVHVLHEGEAVGTGTNVSDVQVQSQIDVMNRDFRKLNADVSTTPAAFLPVTADTRIEFQLAARDPTCGATNGITRQAAGRTFYTASQAKSAGTGGVDPWDPEKYLNIWVVPDLRSASGNDILGSSSFPADALNQQGFVVDFEFLGNIGTGTTNPRFNDGRTAVHEFGHFFNLQHIWADDDDRDGVCDDPPECDGSDGIDDTPNAGEPNFNTPVAPLTDCCTAGDGVMFMNYLDYVDDSAMVMFTQDQATMMVATLYGTKASLIGSDGLLPPPDGGASPDLFMQDTPEDIGDEPNNESTTFYISEDIWIREGTDGIVNQEHENPEYTGAGSTASVYVRVRNRGCADAASEDVRLYWAKASSGLSWPDPWDGSVTVDGAVMGGEITPLQPTGTVPDGGYTILQYTWTLPDPADYSSFGADRVHFCLLARIGPDAGMTTPETASLWDNVKNNNNIVWKNVSVAESSGGGDREAHGLVGNFQEDDLDVSLLFDVPKGEFSFFDVGDVFVDMPEELLKRWIDQGSPGTGIAVVANDRVQLLHAGAVMEQLRLAPDEVFAVRVEFKETKRRPGPFVYFLDMTQFHGPVTSNNPMGGLRFWVKVWNREKGKE